MTQPTLSAEELIRGALGAGILMRRPPAGEAVRFNSLETEVIKRWLNENPPEGAKVMCHPESHETEPKLSEVDPIEKLALMLKTSPSTVREAIRNKWTQLCYLAHKAHDEMERDKKLSTLLTTYVSPANLDAFLKALEKEGLEIVPKQRKAM